MSLLLTPREELLWLAALIDGEGCFTVNKTYPNIVVLMGDEDVIRLAHQRAGVGHVNGPFKSKNPKHTPMWRWKVSGAYDVFQLCKLLLPYMSVRRSAKIRTILKMEKPSPEPLWVRVERWENT